MADAPQTLALITLGQFLRGDVVRQINRRSALLRILPIIPGSGQNCAWSVEADGQIGETYADGADAANFGSDAQQQAVLGWSRTRSNFTVTGTARRAARTAQAGPGGMRDLIGRNMVNSSAKVASTVNAALFSGAGTTNNIAGLDVAIADTTNTYATINRATLPANAFWLPTVTDPGSLTAPTFAQIRADRTAIFKACGESPDIAVCSPEVFDTVGGLYDATRRYVTEVSTPRGKVTLDAGFQGLELDGMVFIKDKDATANRIYYLNSNYIEIWYQPLEPEAMGTMNLPLKADDGFGQTPLGIQCVKLAKNGDADRYSCFTELQLVVRKPNAMGCRKNVAT